MRSWAEAILALVVVAGVGLAMFLFTGEPIGSGSTEPTTPVEVDPAAAARGAALAEATGCLSCHTADGGTSVGPTWKGVAGSQRPLATGEFVLADDAYLFNSVLDPSSQVVLNFDPVMPADYGDSLTTDEINDLVAYIKSLS